MRIRWSLLFLTIALWPLCPEAQSAVSPVTPNISNFVGVWRGQFDNLPGVDLVITDEGGSLHGAILFYLHKRFDPNAPTISTPGLPEPIFNIRREDQTLRFQVSHRRARPPHSLKDAPKNFRLKLTAPDQAVFANDSGGAPIVTMKRTDF